MKVNTQALVDLFMSELNRIHFDCINTRMWTLCLIGLAIHWMSGNNRIHFSSLSLEDNTTIQKKKGLQIIPETQDDGFQFQSRSSSRTRRHCWIMTRCPLGFREHDLKALDTTSTAFTFLNYRTIEVLWNTTPQISIASTICRRKPGMFDQVMSKSVCHTTHSE